MSTGWENKKFVCGSCFDFFQAFLGGLLARALFITSDSECIDDFPRQAVSAVFVWCSFLLSFVHILYPWGSATAYASWFSSYEHSIIYWLDDSILSVLYVTLNGILWIIQPFSVTDSQEICIAASILIDLCSPENPKHITFVLRMWHLRDSWEYRNSTRLW